MPAPEPSQDGLPVRKQLRGDRRVMLREIRAEDKDALRSAFDRLSLEARYARFMAFMHELPEGMLDAATHPIPGREFALVAVAEDSEGETIAATIVGGARYAAAPGSDECEFAVAIVDGWRGVGLARHLMQELIAIAGAHGYRRMLGYVLASNSAMRGLARRLGFRDVRDPDDPALRLVTLDLGRQGKEMVGNGVPGGTPGA